jgi:hypothetical protein
MQIVFNLRRLIIGVSATLFLFGTLSTAAHASTSAFEKDSARFNREVESITGDWVAEDWKNGRLHVHIDHPTGYDDFYLKFFAEEPKNGRTSDQALKDNFNGWTIGDVDREREIDIKDLKPLGSNVLLFSQPWRGYKGRTIDLWGIIETKTDFIPVYGSCLEADGKAFNNYDPDVCLKKMSLLLLNIGNGQLKLPMTEAPIYHIGWRGSVDAQGNSLLQYLDTIGAGGVSNPLVRRSIIEVSPLKTIPAATLQREILSYADKRSDGEFVRGTPEAPIWENGWMYRKIPASEGPHIQMAGAVEDPSGKASTVTLLCYLESYMPRCADALKRVVADIRSGRVAERVAARKALGD